MGFIIRNTLSEVTPATIKQIIEEYYPEFEADIFIEDKTITGVIYTKKRRFLEFSTAQREVREFAERAAGNNGYMAYFDFASNRQRYKEALVYNLVKPKMSGVSSMYGVDVEVRINGQYISINLVSWCFRGAGNSKAIACNKVLAIEDEILELSGCKSLSLSTDENREPFIPNYGPADDDWDDDPVNPNWPSRTGNPSGKGRGNNPPKR